MEKNICHDTHTHTLLTDGKSSTCGLFLELRFCKDKFQVSINVVQSGHLTRYTVMQHISGIVNV